MARDDTVRLPKALVLELLQLTKRSLDLVDAVSRSRWEFNAVRLKLEAICRSEGLELLVSQSEAGNVDGIEAEKTPVRRPSAALRAARLSDDEPTQPEVPHPGRRGPR